MSDSVQVTILCEDRQTQCFIRYFLMQKGYDRHEIHLEPLPQSHGGAGDKWVRTRFPELIKAYHNRKRKASTCLIVAIDADPNGTFETRSRWLKNTCDDLNISFRDEEDSVLVIVPKRNIETWLAYLRGETVDEDTEYRKYEEESECRKDVAELVAMCNRGILRLPAPPSLEQACREVGRLPK